MVSKLIDIAKEKGVRGFEGEVLKFNDPMVHILKTVPYAIRFKSEEDCFSFRFVFDEKGELPA